MTTSQLEVYATVEGPGVLIKGFERPAKVFEDISLALYQFYDRKGILFVPEHEKSRDDSGKPITVVAEFDLSRRYSHRVYTGEMDQDGFGKIITPMHGFVNAYFAGKDHKVKYVKDWDFPHAPSEWDEQIFLAYFNLIDRAARLRERDDFIAHIRSGCR